MALVQRTRNGGIMPSFFSEFFDTDKFFEPFSFGSIATSRIPAANVRETEKDYHIELAVPGMTREDMKISVEDNILTISGEKKEEKTDENDRYTRREYSYNSFSRSFQLPDGVRPEEINAGYKDGVLTLNIPKREDQKTGNNRKEISIS